MQRPADAGPGVRPDLAETWLRIVQVHDRITRRVDSALHRRHGLSLTGFETLRLIAEAPGEQASMGEVAEAVGLSRPGVTSTVSRLVADGLVRRERGDGDRRLLHARLTPSGRERVEAASRTHDALVAQLLGSLADDGDLVTAALARVSAAVRTAPGKRSPTLQARSVFSGTGSGTASVMPGALILSSVVVPTIGRPSLDALLRALAAASGPRPAELILVDDRPGGPPLTPDVAGLPPVRIVRTGGGGPARARNLGWRTARTEWVAFLDDDVVPDPDWYERLAADLADLPADVAGSQGRVRVPLPEDRRPTDWERGTAGLATSSWITADLAYRRSALAAVGGFDERFPRAFREDSDLALRVMDAGGRLVRGQRWITHPVRPADRWISLRVQAGNADDVLMRRLHGPTWRKRADAALGRRPQHLAITAAALGAVGLAAARKPGAAGLAALAWAAGTAEFAWGRIAPGPRTRDETVTMALTSAAIPPLASWHFFRGLVQHRRVRPWRGLPDLVLFDRDGTLVHDFPYNGDPAWVRPVDGAKAALDRLRARGVRVGVVSNQSGVARGLITLDQVEACNARLAELLGPFDTVQVCPHGPDDGCTCRKPAPGMVKAACAELDVDPARCVVVGDIGADVDAAAAAGAVGILVPTPVTRRAEVEAAGRRAETLPAAVDDILAGSW